MWHRVECLEDSVSINISLMGASWADLVADAVRQRLLCHAAARAPICMRSLSDGRSQLDAILGVLRAEVDSLVPAVLLPAGLALPRVARVRLPPPLTTDEDDERPVIRRATVFQRSPLAVLLRLPEQTIGEEEEEEEEEEEMGRDGDDEQQMQSVAAIGSKVDRMANEVAGTSRAARLATRCGGEERLVAASDLFLDGCDGSGAGGHDDSAEGGDGANVKQGDFATYGMHSHFGGEELHSMLRVEFVVAQPHVPLMEYFMSAPQSFTAAQAWRALPENEEVPFSVVAATMRVLERYGYFRSISGESRHVP